ncbi:hypothetical protein CC79DRAFT_575629 [Sarocladium strictum]
MANPKPEREPCSSALSTLCKLSNLRQVASTSLAPSALRPIPVTSLDRLAQATEKVTTDDKTGHPEANTVLYLAYGSNLSAETFLGVRGIKPLSQVNVSVPTLRLTFDLPGIPYGEPCFANVDWRKLPKHPEVPPVPKLPPTPPIEPPIEPPKSPKVGPPFTPTDSQTNSAHTQMRWDGELVGVVYEVTKEDYSHIIQTEGGGASYKEIVVPCIPLPPAMEIPEKPPIPELPRPFLARTLFAPYIPTDKLPDDPNKDKWWYKFVVPPHRPSQDYAQASARYLKLIRDGAREHELPEAYQRYLHSLQPYTITTCRQKIGRLIFVGVLLPLVMLFFAISKLFADKNGKLPPALMLISAAFFNISWKIYDNVLKPTFGDGERTEDKKGKHGQSQIWRPAQTPSDEEKASLLGPESS